MSDFRISMWPGQPVPVPEVITGWQIEVEYRRVIDGSPIWEGQRASEVEPYLVFGDKNELFLETPPDELYLRELSSLDVTNVDDVIRFCARYGRFGPHQAEELPRDYLPGGRMYEILDNAGLDSGFPGRVLEEPGLESLRETAIYVKLIRDMTRVWQYHQGLLTFEQAAAAWENPVWFTSGDDDEPILVPQQPSDLYVFLKDFLKAALVNFSVRPLFPDHEDARLEEEPCSLYSALCLQLANHIAEGTEYRTCKKCGRLFYRQRGRAEFEQFRTKGRVDYCSKECGHQAAQQNYYRRHREAKKEGGSAS